MDDDRTKDQLAIELKAANDRILALQANLDAISASNINKHSFFEPIIDYLSSPVYIKDTDGKYIDCNKLFEDFLQLRRDEIIGKTSYDIIPNERAKIHEEKDKILYQEGGIISYECEIHRPNGKPHVAWFRKAIFCNKSGAPGGIIGEIIDITERTKYEQALIVREEEFRTLVENIPDIIIRYSSDLRRIYVNPAWEKASGLSANDVINQPFIRTPQVPIAWYDEYVQKLRNALTTGIPEVTAFKWVNTREETLFLEYTLIPEYDRTGKIAGVLVVGHDLTERKRAEEALELAKHESEQAQRQLEFKNLILSTQQNVSIEGILIVDQNRRILSYNRRFVELWGISDEVINTKSDNLTLQSVLSKLIDPQHFIDKVDYLYKNHQGKSWDEIALNDGRIFDRYSAPMLDSNGTYFGRVWFFNDITERKNAVVALDQAKKELELRVEQRTKELRLANERLLELDQLKSNFLATVSHDLRTPLTSILGFTKLIRRDFERKFLPLTIGSEKLLAKGTQIHKNLAIIENEGERLTRLINDFLDISKIEAGKMEWRDQNISPNFIIERAVQAVSGELELNPALSITLNVIPNLPLLRVDPDRLVQVFVNLLTNAIKFTTEGLICVNVYLAPNDCIHFSVHDNGTGIDSCDIPKIFEKFYQAHRDNPDPISRKGTGLGLAICRDILEHYNGSITVDSQKGHGATFTVELPIRGTA